MNANIKLQDVSLKFRIYKNPTPSLKETFINLVSRRRQADDVMAATGSPVLSPPLVVRTCRSPSRPNQRPAGKSLRVM